MRRKSSSALHRVATAHISPRSSKMSTSPSTTITYLLYWLRELVRTPMVTGSPSLSFSILTPTTNDSLHGFETACTDGYCFLTVAHAPMTAPSPPERCSACLPLGTKWYTGSALWVMHVISARGASTTSP